ncbi:MULTISPECIES: FAD-dependent monooxygenase [Streptomyces]|uniref:FAD-dependent monooxygenase n=1 Tax=Streptomyces TaxID=1883 RepID=UPI0023DD02AB|nr:FAD-dependent monooxygenase [Streptomyces sp. FXJ1.172]WEP00633.1 FAD-dependent monooxygenase [Streptomyces sp. FXJ1.172]
MPIRTQVAIIGAGPAGLTLAAILQAEGVDCVVVEKHPLSYVEARARAALIEPRTVAALDRYGLADRLLVGAVAHGSCEFRNRGERFSVPSGVLAGGRQHTVYPQQPLVADLVAARAATGGALYFSHPAVSVTTGPLGERGTITVESARTRERLTVDCDVIAGCDGFHGISRAAIPVEHLEPHGKRHDSAWLAVLADAPPSTREIVYALHDDGYAGHMLRTPRQPLLPSVPARGHRRVLRRAPRVTRTRTSGIEVGQVGAEVYVAEADLHIGQGRPGLLQL